MSVFICFFSLTFNWNNSSGILLWSKSQEKILSVLFLFLSYSLLTVFSLYISVCEILLFPLFISVFILPFQKKDQAYASNLKTVSSVKVSV